MEWQPIIGVAVTHSDLKISMEISLQIVHNIRSRLLDKPLQLWH